MRVTLIKTRTIAVSLAIALLLSITALSTSAFASTTYSIMSGANRYDTMAKLTADMASPYSDVAILATGTNFPDALAASSFAGSLAASKGGSVPVVITDSKSLSSQARTVLVDRLKVKKVYLVGGTAALSSTVETQLKSAGIQTSRIAGSARSRTANMLAKAMPVRSNTNTAIIVTGTTYPDALSIAPYAYATRSPIFLTERNTLTPETQATIKSQGLTNAIIVGGTSAVPASVESQLRNSGVTSISRWWGQNRYQTSSVIADNSVKAGVLSYSGSYIATGRNFPDALSAGAVAGSARVPLLLADNTATSALDDHLLSNTNVGSIDRIVFAGGDSAVPPALRQHVTNAISQGGFVYHTPTGQKYHKTSECASLKQSTTKLSCTQQQAQRQGLTACKLCYH